MICIKMPLPLQQPNGLPGENLQLLALQPLVMTYVTCYHKMSVKSPDNIQRYSLLNMSQNNRKQRKINTKYWFLLDKTRSYTHILYIILKLALWGIGICNNFKYQLLLLYAHFVIAGHIYHITHVNLQRCSPVTMLSWLFYLFLFFLRYKVFFISAQYIKCLHGWYLYICAHDFIIRTWHCSNFMMTSFCQLHL